MRVLFFTTLWRSDDKGEPQEPPFRHIILGDNEVIVEIESGKTTGHISPRALNMVQEWRQLHREELIADWKLAEQNKPLRRIDPLE